MSHTSSAEVPILHHSPIAPLTNHMLSTFLRHEQKVDRCGAGNGVPPLVLQSGHRERRSTGTEDWHWVLPSILSSRRTMAGPQVGSGWRPCLSRGRRDGFSGTPWSTSSTSCPTFRSSMCLCHRWRNQLVEFMQRLDTVTSVHHRSAKDLSGPNPTALYGVPTVVSFSSLHHSAEQIIDIPVPRGRRGSGGGLQSFLPAQNSTAPWSGFFIFIRNWSLFGRGVGRCFFALFPEGKSRCMGTPAHPS